METSRVARFIVIGETLRQQQPGPTSLQQPTSS